MPEIATRDAGCAVTQRLRTHTAALHRRAERSGVVALLLSGTVSLEQHATYLRNLLPAYQTMERALRRRRGDSCFAAIADEAVFRADAIITDLEHLAGRNWRQHLPAVVAADRYAERVAAVANGPGLIGHAYTRYLGDLNGGRFLHQRLTRLFGTSRFTEFPAIADPARFARAYRAALDRACPVSDAGTIVEEADFAFRLNIAVSEAVAAIAIDRAALSAGADYSARHRA